MSGATAADGALTDAALTDAETALLREAIALADEAVRAGDHPFGALLADASGTVVLRARNTVETDRDVTAHAETNLVRMASRELWNTDLSAHTLFTSCEPCAMCTGAVFWLGVGRVVFALSESGLRAIPGAEPALAVPCREVFAHGSRPTVVVGPALAEDAAVAHHAFWP